jgi:hypothetical protein
MIVPKIFQGANDWMAVGGFIGVADEI